MNKKCEEMFEYTSFTLKKSNSNRIGCNLENQAEETNPMKKDTTNVFFRNIICIAQILYVSHLNAKTYLIDCLELRIG